MASIKVAADKKHSLTGSALHDSKILSRNPELVRENYVHTSTTLAANHHKENATESIYEDFTEFNELEDECEELWEDSYIVDNNKGKQNFKTYMDFGKSDSQEKVFRSSMLSNRTFSSDLVKSFAQSENKSQLDFFENLGTVPDIKDFSTDTLQGKFVDPLSGNDVSDEVLLVVSNYEDETPEHSETLEENSSMMELEEFSFEDFDTRYPEEKIEIKEDEPIDKRFTAIEVPSLTRIRVAEVSKSKIDSEAQIVLKTIENFLTELINETIRLLTQENDSKDTRQLLCKTDLTKKLKISVSEFSVEQKINSLLNRKVVEYFRRKGLKRYIEEETNETVLSERILYKDKCQELDCLLGREVELKDLVEHKTHALNQQIEYFEQKENKAQLNFGNLVRKMLKCDVRPKLAFIVDKELAQMINLKKEISSTRAIVIQRLHTLSTLQEQIQKVEYIGDGRSVADYELLQSKTGALSKKIEDRQTELAKMHKCFHLNVHMMSHSQIKRKSVSCLTKIKMKSLFTLLEEEHKCHQELFLVQRKRKRTRQQIKELSQQCGLLDKPALLYDYDRIMEYLEKKRENVDQLRKSYMELTKKIQQKDKNVSLTKSTMTTSEKKSNLKLQQKKF